MIDYKILISKPAKEELFAIKEYIEYELKEPDIAEKLVRKLVGAIYSLSSYPERCGLVRAVVHRIKGVRKLLCGNYVILFIINKEDNTVMINRIMYSKRNWIEYL